MTTHRPSSSSLLSLLLVSTLLLLLAPREAQAQSRTEESSFLVMFDQDRLPRAVETGEELGRLLARSLQARYDGKRPVEVVLVGAVLHGGEIVDEFRSPSFTVEPGRVRFPDSTFERLFPDSTFERLFPDGYFDVYFPDSTFMPDDVEERLGRHQGPLLFVALLPADREAREKAASRAAVLTFDPDR